MYFYCFLEKEGGHMRIRQWLVFMLLPFLLCACAGQEAVEEPLVVLGDTYVKDGIRQNTHV